FLWTFGDGASSHSQSPTHSYTEQGLYTATLTVTDSHGGQGIWILKVWA
ncbi:MAG TPA: PKD domain-containing protein, partial [Thermoplasmata archaeon]|nr:PKD domain-containing protein [Thermoplasmata archaeon]